MDNSEKLSLFRSGTSDSIGLSDVRSDQSMKKKKIEFTLIEKGIYTKQQLIMGGNNNDDQVMACLPYIVCFICLTLGACKGLIGCPKHCNLA